MTAVRLAEAHDELAFGGKAVTDSRRVAHRPRRAGVNRLRRHRPGQARHPATAGATNAISHRPLAGAEQANFREVYGRILRRVAAEFGEDIALDAASAWG